MEPRNIEEAAASTTYRDIYLIFSGRIVPLMASKVTVSKESLNWFWTLQYHKNISDSRFHT
jgi:hypothetical protein